MSGDKLVLYFAAESEVQAQNWMKELRDGLWPSCFSFQMLTAYSHEVSLIDDENSFLAGHLGVYGRFVLSSEDVISLMHPHWGCTLLQISLSNVHDVLFIREAEIQPAGVFSIVFKRNEDSKVKALQFFCDTALDTIQWILSKIYAKNDEKDNERPKYKFAKETSTLVSDDIVSLKSNTTEYLDFRNTDPTQVNPPISTDKVTDSYLNIVDSNTDYENLQYLRENPLFNMEDTSLNTVECSVRGKRHDLADSSEQISWNIPKSIDSSIPMGKENDYNEYLVNKLSNSKLNEGKFYAKIEHSIDSTTAKSQNYSNSYVNDAVVSKGSTDYTSIFISKEDIGLKQKLAAPKNDTSNHLVYSTINKKGTQKDSRLGIAEEKFLFNELSNKESVIYKNLSESKDSNLHDAFSSNSDNRNADYSVATSTNNLICNYLSTDLRNKCEAPIYQNVDLSSKDYVPTFDPHGDSNSLIFGVINKQMNSHCDSVQTQSAQFFKNSFSSGKNLRSENNQLLLNISSDFLNTSFTNSIRQNNKARSESSSSDGDSATLPWVTDEFINEDFSERIYEDILDRKGTIYEEIDSSESDNECTFPLPPSLPERPKNLEIPSSLRLQKLSKSIQQTLEVTDSSLSQKKRYPHQTFIKKIKDVSRIMQISPTQESSREPFTVETKLPIHIAKDMFALKPKVVSTPVKIDNVQNESGAIFKPRYAK